jgi:regulator of replication initiation timing
MASNQLGLFEEELANPVGREDRLMGRKDGRACCHGQVEETPYRQTIGAWYEQERAKLEAEKLKHLGMLHMEVISAQDQLSEAVQHRKIAEQNARIANNECRFASELLQRLVLRGLHVCNINGHYDEARRTQEKAEREEASAERKAVEWERAELSANSNLRECSTRLDNMTRFFNVESRRLEIRRDDRYRQYDMGYLETHRHRPPWL